MVRYFIGSVLSPYEKEECAEGDETFAFTRKQADELDLTNIPVRMEHHPDMKVGHIIRSWSEKDGSKWCLGKLDHDGFQGKFSQHAVDKNPDTGKPYYEGLSLQHAHIQLASGKHSTAKKEAIEVSLVCEPRRSDCKIAFVDGEDEPKQDQIKKTTYILKQTPNKMSTDKNVSEATPEQVNPGAESSTANDGKNSMAGTMTKEAMMKIIIEQQKTLEQSKNQQNDELEELRKLKQEIERQKEDEKRKQAEKSYAMAKTVVDQWSETLDKQEMSDATKQTILDASKTHPEQMIELLRVAHCASKKYQEANARFNEYKSLMEKTQLSKQFDAVMAKKAIPAAVEQAPARQAPVVHAASKKRKVMSDPEMFLKALSQYNSSGSARDHMEAVSQIGARKSYNRQTYY
jgi:chemotaxis protein histidine kinase CheA